MRIGPDLVSYVLKWEKKGGGAGTNGHRAICTPPLPMYFITNRCKKGGVSENRSSFSLLFVVVQIRGGGYK